MTEDEIKAIKPHKKGAGRGRPTNSKTRKAMGEKVFNGLSLNRRQIMYVLERFNPENNDNKLLAYKKAGFSFKSESVGKAAMHRLENMDKMREAFKRYIDYVIEDERDKLRLKILKELQIQAFYDPNEFFNPDGTLKPLNSIRDELRPCVTQIETKAYGKDAYVITNYKLVDKTKAQKLLMEYLSMMGNASTSTDFNSKEITKKSEDAPPSVTINVG